MPQPHHYVLAVVREVLVVLELASAPQIDWAAEGYRCKSLFVYRHDAAGRSGALAR